MFIRAVSYPLHYCIKLPFKKNDNFFWPTWRSYKLTCPSINVRLSVRPSVTSFSRDLIFGTEMQKCNAQNVTETDFWKKNTQKKGFIDFAQNLDFPDFFPER